MGADRQAGAQADKLAGSNPKPHAGPHTRACLPACSAPRPESSARQPCSLPLSWHTPPGQPCVSVRVHKYLEVKQVPELLVVEGEDAIKEDHVCTGHTRAVLRAGAGHKVVDWDLYGLQEAVGAGGGGAL
jgi:hypothetical protein